MIDLGIVKPGSTIFIPFSSHAGSTGASSAMTGLATSDILAYKDGSVTERASTSGYTLLDTDGLDFDGKTGINGVSIDLSDNTTADFWQAGSRYWIVIGDVTVDSQTVRFVAATFVIGLPGAVLNTFIATLASQTSFTLNTGPAEDDALNGCVVYIHDAASAVQGGFAVVSDYTGSTKTVTLAAGTTFTVAAKDNIMFMPPVLLAGVTHTGAVIPTVTTVTNQLTAAQIATGVWQDSTAGDFTAASSIGKSLYTSGNAPGAASGIALVGSNMGTVTSVTGAVGSVTGNVGGNVTGSVGSVVGAVGSVTGNVGGNVSGSVGSVVAAVAITSNIKQNQALSGFTFLMTDSTNHAPMTGATVAVTRSIDGGAFGAGALSAVSEVGNGVYSVNFGAADLNGKTIILRATATGADDTFERIVTQV